MTVGSNTIYSSSREAYDDLGSSLWKNTRVGTQQVMRIIDVLDMGVLTHACMFSGKEKSETNIPCIGMYDRDTAIWLPPAYNTVGVSLLSM